MTRLTVKSGSFGCRMFDYMRNKEVSMSEACDIANDEITTKDNEIKKLKKRIIELELRVSELVK